VKQFDVLILGGGAAGLMCAAHVNQNSDLHVGIIEGNDQLARKLRISGGGKCNITNVEVDASHYLGEEIFVDSVLESFSKEDLLRFLKQQGLKPVIRKDRYYFCPESSEEIITILRRLSSKTTMLLGQKILQVKRASEFEVTTQNGVYRAKKLVVATGAASYQSIGASSIGLDIARSFGHTVMPFHPVLVGLTLQRDQFWMKELSGISMPVRIRVGDKTLEEDLLFAHKGISGPAVLSASLYWHKGEIAIDFLPALHVRDLCRGTKKQISSAIPLPRRFMKAFMEALGIEDVACNRLTSETLAQLERLHAYTMAPAGNFGFTKAEACRGGVATSEIHSSTMQSLQIKGLYFIGEVTDVTGELGGYNFQWAFSSAVVCARDLLKKD